MTNAKTIISQLELVPHPERGYYRRTYTSEQKANGRASGSAIYYLLEGGRFARKHRIDADELWLWHAGAALSLEITKDDGSCDIHILGADLAAGQQPQILAPANQWQRARCDGDWTLVSCVVSPAFEFEHFEMDE